MAFCRRYRCPDGHFEKAVLRRCFPPLSKALAVIALALRPDTFQRELALIRRLGTTGPGADVRGELEGYAYENQRDKSARTQTFGLRLSRRRFLRLWRTTFEGVSPPPSSLTIDSPPSAPQAAN